jgi:hypothetical protein
LKDSTLVEKPYIYPAGIVHEDVKLLIRINSSVDARPYGLLIGHIGH